jgi:hypothetical protein
MVLFACTVPRPLQRSKEQAGSFVDFLKAFSSAAMCFVVLGGAVGTAGVLSLVLRSFSSRSLPSFSCANKSLRFFSPKANLARKSSRWSTY